MDFPKISGSVMDMFLMEPSVIMPIRSMRDMSHIRFIFSEEDKIPDLREIAL